MCPSLLLPSCASLVSLPEERPGGPRDPGWCPSLTQPIVLAATVLHHIARPHALPPVGPLASLVGPLVAAPRPGLAPLIRGLATSLSGPLPQPPSFFGLFLFSSSFGFGRQHAYYLCPSGILTRGFRGVCVRTGGAALSHLPRTNARMWTVGPSQLLPSLPSSRCTAVPLVCLVGCVCLPRSSRALRRASRPVSRAPGPHWAD